ncbi:MAG: histidine phosphatase family protein [Clostridia bacterium]|nr:histidine phosphatase family protein [Clostridia bacterium]
MRFFYVRHGDPIYEPDSLTPLGHRQAEAVGRRLARYGIDEIYASTSNRAILTATPLSELTKKEIKTLDFANEGHAWESLTIMAKNPDRKTFLFHSLEAREAFRTPECRALGFEWYLHPQFEGYKYKEGIERIRRESDAFFESLGYKHEGCGKYKVIEHSDKRIAFFAHQGFGMAFLPCILGIPYSEFATRFDLLLTGITAINFYEEAGYAYPIIYSMSNDGHLYEDNLSIDYYGAKF